MLCIWWDQKGLVYYELLKLGDSITGDRYRLQLIRLSRALREKRLKYEQRYDQVILLHDNARPHVAKIIKKYLETLKWDVLPHVFSGHCSFWLLIVPKDAAVHFFRRNRKLVPKLDRLQKRIIFSRWNSKIAWEMGKSNRQRWTIFKLICSFILFWNKCTKKRTKLICTPNTILLLPYGCPMIPFCSSFLKQS